MTSTPPPPPSTLFPKISGKHADFVKLIQFHRTQYHRETRPETFPSTAIEIQLVGTVKLHGTHNDIVVTADNKITLQSRNLLSLGLENDSYKFAKTLLPLQPEILALKERIHARFREKNPGTSIEPEHPLIIAGEWIGPGVQKSVAINELPKKLLVIISIAINDCWQPDEDYADVSNPEVGIYHVSRGGFFRHTLPLGTSQEMIASLAALQPLADEVERECPFAKTFGLVGAGEGIVFKPTTGTLGEDAEFWLKVRGPVSMGGPKVPTVKKGVGLEDGVLAKSFAEATVTEPRLEQAWDYLRETGVERNMGGMGKFLRWLNNDIVVEEKTEMEELGVNQSLLNKEIIYLGKVWFSSRVKQEGN